MIRSAVWRIYVQTNVTALIISICLIICQTERCIATCWMWGNEKKNIEKKCNKSQIYSCSGPVRQTSIVVSGSTNGLIWVSWVNKSTWQSERAVTFEWLLHKQWVTGFNGLCSPTSLPVAFVFVFVLSIDAALLWVAVITFFPAFFHEIRSNYCWISIK